VLLANISWLVNSSNKSCSLRNVGVVNCTHLKCAELMSRWRRHWLMAAARRERDRMAHCVLRRESFFKLFSVKPRLIIPCTHVCVVEEIFVWRLWLWLWVIVLSVYKMDTCINVYGYTAATPCTGSVAMKINKFIPFRLKVIQSTATPISVEKLLLKRILQCNVARIAMP